MKINDKKELKLKSVTELEKLIKEASAKFAQLKMDNVQSKLKNTRSLSNTRKEIAVMKSFLHLKFETKEGESK
jgi:ribosomal protein L29